MVRTPASYQLRTPWGHRGPLLHRYDNSTSLHIRKMKAKICTKKSKLILFKLTLTPVSIAIYGCCNKVLLSHNLMTLFEDFPSSCFQEVFTRTSSLPASLYTLRLGDLLSSPKSTSFITQPSSSCLRTFLRILFCSEMPQSTMPQLFFFLHMVTVAWLQFLPCLSSFP